MARYTYNAGLVTQTIDTLYTACDCLDNTNVDMKKGIDTILNARGAENINIDFSPITGYQSTVIEHIELMATELKNKAQEVEDYQNAPWWKKLFATIGMGALKLVEGLASFVENIGDGLVSIVGFIGGIFSSDFKNSVAEFVRTDLVGETTAKWYEEGWLKDVNKYSIMSHQSTAANILKGVGTAAGYVILTVATAGAGGAVAAASTAISAGAAAVGGIGSGTQNALKQAQLANPEMSAGDAFNSAFGQGVKQGAIAAGTTLLTAGMAKGIQNLGAGGKFATFADKIDDATALGKVAHGAQNLLNKGAEKVMSNGFGAKVVHGANKLLTGAGNYVDDVANTIAGKSMSSAITQAAGNVAAAGGTAVVTNAISSVAGATASGQFKANTESAQIDQFIKEVSTPTVGAQLYGTAQDVLNSEGHDPTMATEEEAKENLQELQDSGYGPTDNPTPEDTAPGQETPGGEQTTTDGSTDTSQIPTTGGDSSHPTSGDSSPSNGGGGYTVDSDTITMPDYPSGNDNVTDDTNIVGGVNPGISGDSNTTSGGTIGEYMGALDDSAATIDDNAETVSSEVLDTFGDVSGALSNISGTRTSIPTSSSPILSSTEKTSSKSFVPLGAGLGAASIAGIGAKAYLDKREKNKDEEDENISTEEWSEDNIEIDYGAETTEESDYLSPTDELAFQE